VIAVELVKQTRRARGWVTVGAMAAVPLLLSLVIALTRPALPERIGSFGAVVTDTSGLTMPLIALTAAVLFLLPLGVAVLAGEAVAGEAAWGTLRYLMARPVSRSRIFLAKAAVAAAWSAAAVAIVPASSLLAGVIAFGWRPLTVVDLEHTTIFQVAASTFPPGDALGRLALATGLVLCAMASTFGFGLLLSTLTRSPFSAAAGGVGLGLVSRALDNIPGLSALGPWLPMTDSGTTLWSGLFFHHLDPGAVAHLALVQAAYTSAFMAVAWARFVRSDVLA
jgi:ABC-2 type transport system permease protein